MACCRPELAVHRRLESTSTVTAVIGDTFGFECLQFGAQCHQIAAKAFEVRGRFQFNLIRVGSGKSHCRGFILTFRFTSRYGRE